jgi:hypothetical protein
MKVAFATLTSLIGLISALPASFPPEETAVSQRGESAADNFVFIILPDAEADGTPQSAYGEVVAAADPSAVLGRRFITGKQNSPADLRSLSTRNNDIILFLVEADAEGQDGPYDQEVATADPNAVLGQVRLSFSQTSQ